MGEVLDELDKVTTPFSVEPSKMIKVDLYTNIAVARTMVTHAKAIVEALSSLFLYNDPTKAALDETYTSLTQLEEVLDKLLTLFRASLETD